MGDNVIKKVIEWRLIEARAFREISLLVLGGIADKDPNGFIANVKTIMQRVAEKEAALENKAAPQTPAASGSQ